MMRQAKYGIDAPRLVYTLAILGGVFLLCAIVFYLHWPPFIPIQWDIGVASVGVLLLLSTVIMVRSSLVTKVQIRDRLVEALALLGNECVLDAGCGQGLALIGCAKKLTSGKAVGIDLWSSKDLSNNSLDATRANALSEGVANRVEVETGDIIKLPFPDESFDVVISMTVIHNISPKHRRDKALRELVRVMKPGGRIAVFDIRHTDHYIEVLQGIGMEVRSLGRDFLWLQPCGALIGTKPWYTHDR